MSDGTATEPVRGERELAASLANRRWLMRSKPFPHVVAANVFAPETYARLESSFREVLARSMGGYLEGHDIHGTGLSAADAEAFSPLLSRGWHDMIANVFGISATGHVSCGIHHHAIGSASGAPHTDVNPGWFNGEPAPGSLEFTAPEWVEYTDGQVLQDGATPQETVRAVALLYYVANPPWYPGDGGETGVYRSLSDPADRAILRVPPRNNSLFAFECTPRSFHGFISNAKSERSTIIMWLHRSKEDVLARWGEDVIESYSTPSRP